MRLSICIPTYNRAEYLPALLDTIVAQDNHSCDIEVVISDNASTDNTEAAIAPYRDRFERFVYHRAETNQGADRNFLKVVDLASGDFCWLMGSDDVLEPGSVATIERALHAHPDIAGLSVTTNSYDFAIKSRVIQAPVQGVPSTTALLRTADEIYATLGDYFGYISSNVIDRKLWDSVVVDNPVEEYFNAWVHVYIIGKMIQERPAWLYVAEPCVGWRSGNDSFLSEGMYRRLEIDVAGYAHVTCGLFGRESKVYRHVMSKILKHALFRLRHARANGAPSSFFKKARRLLFNYYRGYPEFWIKGFPVFLVPSAFAASVRWIYRHSVKPLRLARLNK